MHGPFIIINTDFLGSLYFILNPSLSLSKPHSLSQDSFGLLCATMRRRRITTTTRRTPTTKTPLHHLPLLPTSHIAGISPKQPE